MGPVLAVDGVMFADKALIPLWEKVQAGERLSYEDGLAMYRSDDFLSLGRMADFARRKKSGDNVYFVLSRHINPTNICVLSCKFCDFARKKGQDGAYEMTTQQVLDLLTPEIREAHIVGGHHPDWTFEHFEEMLKAIHENYPNALIKAFTAAEYYYFEKRWKVPVEEALERFKKVGLVALPGGGAEVFSERMRKLLFPGKIGAKRWLDIHRMAHKKGLPSNATLLYGHLETYAERIEHFRLLRELQDETNGFLAFIALEYQTGDTHLVERQASAIDNLKTIAIARLMLDNFPHIKAYWVMMSEEAAAIALNFGADDMDGTIGKELIAHAAKARSPEGLARERIVRLVRDAGRVAVERDALYRTVKVYDC